MALKGVYSVKRRNTGQGESAVPVCPIVDILSIIGSWPSRDTGMEEKRMNNRSDRAYCPMCLDGPQEQTVLMPAVYGVWEHATGRWQITSRLKPHAGLWCRAHAREEATRRNREAIEDTLHLHGECVSSGAMEAVIPVTSVLSQVIMSVRR